MDGDLEGFFVGMLGAYSGPMRSVGHSSAVGALAGVITNVDWPSGVVQNEASAPSPIYTTQKRPWSRFPRIVLRAIKITFQKREC